MVATLHNRPPFDLDETLLRYLSELENGYYRRHQPDTDVPEDDFLKRNRILILRFEKDENIDHATGQRFLNFVSYFEKKKILDFLDFHEYWSKYLQKTDIRPTLFFELKDPYTEFEYSPYLYVEVLDIEALKKFREKYILENEIILPANKIRTADEVLYEKGILQFGLKVRYELRSKFRTAMMEELWPGRIKGSKNKNGFAKDANLLAHKIFNTDSKNDITKQQLKKIDRLIIDLNSYFKDKGLLLEIKKRNNLVQMYETNNSEK